MKIYNYLTIGISLIFTVMGILILSGAYNTAELFSNNELFRWLFGFILVIYGIFRTFNAVMKLKQKSSKTGYFDNGEE